MRITFADHNRVGQFTAQGEAFHEGQLHGQLNRLTGLLAVLGLVLPGVTGALIGWRRRRKGRLGLPPMPADRRLAPGLVVLVICPGIVPPLAGIILVLALVADLLFDGLFDWLFDRATGRGRKQPA